MRITKNLLYLRVARLAKIGYDLSIHRENNMYVLENAAQNVEFFRTSRASEMYVYIEAYTVGFSIDKNSKA
jgi:hypothetical protein